MPTGLFHESMIDGLEERFRKQKCSTRRQFPTRSGRQTGYVDLLVDHSERRLLVEVEMSTRRILSDVAKLRDVQKSSPAATLWIVVPDSRLKKASQSILRASGIEVSNSIYVFTYGKALQQVPNWIPFCPASWVRQKAGSGTKQKSK